MVLTRTEAERYRAEAIEMFKVPPEDSSLEERSAFFFRVSPLESSIRAIYNQHQKTGCKCEWCQAAEGVFAWIDKLGEVKKQKPDR
jgi:hypothetical protein